MTYLCWRLLFSSLSFECCITASIIFCVYGPVYSKIRRKYIECILTSLWNNDSRDADSIIKHIIEMDSSMNLSLEMSWNNLILLSSKIIPFFWKGQLKRTGIVWKSEQNFCRNHVHISNSKRDCHRMFKGTFLPDFHVISETKIIILAIVLIIIVRSGPDSCYQAIFIPLQMEL